MSVSDDILAFPFQATFGGDVMEPSFGMTLRDWFAGQALVGIGTWRPSHGGILDSPEAHEDRARFAYSAADAMLAARSAEPHAKDVGR